MPRTVYVAVSYHGFGHIAQTAPVVNKFTRRVPNECKDVMHRLNYPLKSICSNAIIT